MRPFRVVAVRHPSPPLLAHHVAARRAAVEPWRSALFFGLALFRADSALRCIAGCEGRPTHTNPAPAAVHPWDVTARALPNGGAARGCTAGLHTVDPHTGGAWLDWGGHGTWSELRPFSAEQTHPRRLSLVFIGPAARRTWYLAVSLLHPN